MRAHQLVDSTLNGYLLKKAFEAEDVDLELLNTLVQDALTGKIKAETLNDLTLLQNIATMVCRKKGTTIKKSYIKALGSVP